MPRESRNVYDHAVRTLGVRIIEVNSPAELRVAISPHTAMIVILGSYFGGGEIRSQGYCSDRPRGAFPYWWTPPQII